MDGRGWRLFFSPQSEILVAWCAEEIVGYLRTVSQSRACEIGDNMHRRALREHTYTLRAMEFQALVLGQSGNPQTEGMVEAMEDETRENSGNIEHAKAAQEL